MKLMKSTATACLILAVSVVPSFATPRVVASIKPVHSLVAAVMAGVGEPGIIVTGSASPHTYALTPRDAESLQNADVVFWLGHELETFMEKPLEALSGKAKAVGLIDAQGIETLPVRENANFDAHDHGEASANGQKHDHDEHDAHVWLDPQNAIAMVQAISTTLSNVDPEHAAIYEKNAASMNTRLEALQAEIMLNLAPVKGKPFIVFHDAYQYFEHRFGLKAAGAISIHPENPPGAAQITTLRQRIKDGNAVCVFAEPQFDNKLVQVIAEGTNAKIGTLDPEGAPLEPGPDLYTQLLKNLQNGFLNCLK